MTRSVTPFKTRNPPAKVGKKVSSNKSCLLRSVFKPSRAANIDKQQKHSPFDHKAIRNSPYNRPVLAPKNKLQTIREEPFEEEEETEELGNVRPTQDDSANASFYRDFNMDEMSNAEDQESSDDSDYEGWDDETTLVAKFQENAPEQASRADLAYELEGPMQMRADQLKHYLAHTLAPATRKVKEIHCTLEQKVDVAFGVGVLSFDDSCKKIEQLSLRDEDDIKQIYTDTQRNVREYFKQLKEAYQKREKLWKDLREAVEKSASKTIASATALPSEIDDAVASIEKKAREVTKPGGKDNKAKMLRELLAEM